MSCCLNVGSLDVRGIFRVCCGVGCVGAVLPFMTLGDSRVESRSLSRQAPSSTEPGTGCGASRDVTMSARSMFLRAVYRLSTDRKTHRRETAEDKEGDVGLVFHKEYLCKIYSWLSTHSWPVCLLCWPTG